MTNLSLASVLLQSLHLLWIGNSVAESPIDGDQLGMGNRYDGTLTPAPQLQALVTRLEKRLLVRRPSPWPFASGWLATTGCPVVLAASSFAGALIVARTDSRPRCQMMTVGERAFWTHVHSGLC